MIGDLFFRKFSLTLVIGFILLCALNVQADNSTGNISTTEKFAWSENSGWLNGRPTYGGITVHADRLSGYAWSENIGWIKMGPSDGESFTFTWGVKIDTNGNLTGFAWAENAGWIDFNPIYSQVTFDKNTGSFAGYCWSENVGYIHLKNSSPAYNILSPRLSISNSYVEENEPSAFFVITLSPVNPYNETTVKYETYDGTSSIFDISAEDGVDYNGVSGTARIPANTSSYTISVSIIDEYYHREKTEKFSVKLFDPVGASINNGIGVCTIADDEAHTIEVTASENGSVTVQTTTDSGLQYTSVVGPSTNYVFANHYTNGICTLKPDPGFEIISVSVDGISQIINVDENGVMIHAFNDIRKDHQINVVFGTSKYTITIPDTPHGYEYYPPGSLENISYNQVRTIEFRPDENYHVESISGCNRTIYPTWAIGDKIVSYDFTITNNCSIYAVYSLDTYLITASVENGLGTIEGAENIKSITSTSNSIIATVEYGTKPKFKFTPNSYYHVQDVKVDNSSKISLCVPDPLNSKICTYTFDKIIDDYILTASFESDQYTINVVTNNGGYVEYAIGTSERISFVDNALITVDYDADMNLYIYPDTNQGYKIADVNIDGLSKERGNLANETHILNNIKKHHYIKILFATKLVTNTPSLNGAFDGDNTHETIQDAINKSNNGEIIAVDSGLYEGFLFKDINNISLKLIAISGASRTFIDGKKEKSAIIVENNTNSTIEIDGFTIQNGYANKGGGLYIKNASPTIKNSRIINNEAGLPNTIESGTSAGMGGGVYIFDNSAPVFTNVEVSNNTAALYGGGFYIDSSVGTTTAIITRSMINKNISYKYGGGFYIGGDGSGHYANPKISSSIISENISVYDGGGFYFNQSQGILYGATITKNSTQNGYGDGIFHNSSRNIYIENSILWSNGREIEGERQNVRISYSDINQTSTGFGSFSNNLKLDPKFKNSAKGDYHLQDTSPCINKGDEVKSFDKYYLFDMDNKPRFYSTALDMGAYEWNAVYPKAAFTVSDPISGYSPLNVTFTDQSIAKNGIIHYQWDFGDGFISTEQSPSHTYTKVGIHTVTLFVRESNGLSATSIRHNLIDVKPYTDTTLVVDFKAQPLSASITSSTDIKVLSGFANFEVQFINLTTSPNGIDSSPYKIDSWYWEFGDGKTSADKAPIQTYTSPGTYRIKLTVTDENGNKYILTRYAYISVINKGPEANFAFIPSTCPPESTSCSITFFDTSFVYEDIAQWEWNFGDGSNPSYKNDQNPIHYYTDLTGSKDVSLKITMSDGSMDTVELPVNVTRTYQYEIPAGQGIQEFLINNIPTADISDDIFLVLVPDGTYQEQIDFKGKRIILKAKNKYKAIIDSENIYSAFNFDEGEDRYSIIDGFVIKNGYSDFGGGVFISNASPTIKNCKFIANTALIGGGAIGMVNSSSPIIINCEIGQDISNYNTARDGAGIGIYSLSNPFIYNTRVIYNKADYNGGGIYCYSNSKPILKYLTISNNTSYVDIYSSYIGKGGGIYAGKSEIIIEACNIKYNNSGQGAGIALLNSQNPVIKRCSISQNKAGFEGGAVYIENSSSPAIINVLINGNLSLKGGGIFFNNVSSPLINFSTIANNNVSSGNVLGIDGIGVSPGLVVKNSIIWNEGVGALQLALNQSDEILINNSTLSQTTGFTGENNLTQNPKFIKYGTTSPNYRLDYQSPCQNKGVIDQTVLKDLDYKYRLVGSVPDMGAYESQTWAISFQYSGNGYFKDDNMSNIPSGSVIGLQDGLDHKFTLVPLSGYRVSEFKIDNISKIADLVNVGNSVEYTMLSVNAPHTIQAEFSKYTVNVRINVVGDQNHNASPLYSEASIEFTSEPENSPCEIVGNGVCSVNVYYGSDITLNAKSTTSTDFDYWSNNPTGPQTQTLSAVTSSKNLTAVFKLKTINVAVIKAGSGSGGITQSVENVKYMDDLTINATPDISSVFSGWSGDVSSTNSKLNLTGLTTGIAITARFDLKPVNVMIKQIGSGGELSGFVNTSTALSPPPTSSDIFTGKNYQLKYGDKLQLIAKYPGSWVFDGWRYTGDSGNIEEIDSKTWNIYSDIDIFAYFSEKLITVSINKTGNGSGKLYKVINNTATEIAAPSTLTVIYGNNLIVRAIPDDSSSKFSGWSGHASGTGDAYLANITTNKSITAAFNLKTFSIASSCGSGGEIIPSGNVVVSYDKNQVFEIKPSEHAYYISDIKVDGISLTSNIAHGSSFNYTFYNVLSNHTIQAFFNRNYLVGTGGYSTIQEAINVSSDGDTVEVGYNYPAKGIYNENIDFKGKDITVIALNPLTTIIDGKQSGHTVKIQSGKGKLSGFIITNGLAELGGGIFIDNASPVIENCRIIYNEAALLGGGVYIGANSSPQFISSTINNNQSNGSGGGIYAYEASPEIKQSKIQNNIAAQNGGGIGTQGTKEVLIVNSLITGNSTNLNGGGIYINSSGNIINTTLSDNDAGQGSAIFAQNVSSPLTLNVLNSILWDHSTTGAAVIDSYNSDAISVNSSNVKRLLGNYPGNNNINLDPQFVDWEMGNYYLENGSPCINEGTESDENIPEVDIDGLERSFYNFVDMGAFEWNADVITVDFNADPIIGNPPLNVIFSGFAHSSAGIVNWNWNFGESTTASSQNYTTMIYTIPGLYKVRLTVTDNDGKTAYKEKTIICSEKPDAKFSADITSGYAPLTVQFNDISEPSSSILSRIWDFGDGSQETIKNPVHIFSQPGIYDIKLTVNDENYSDSELKYSYIQVLSKDPQVDFYATPTLVKAPGKVQFFDKSIIYNANVYRTWNFGDGTSSNEKNPIHEYSIVGKYAVSLTLKIGQFNYRKTKTDHIQVVMSQSVLNVCKTGCPYSTIQSAIDASQTGDSIIVSDGFYLENINFNGKAVSVTSMNGPSGAIILGQENGGSVVTFEKSETSRSKLMGFTIRDGLNDFGGGVLITNSSSPTIENCAITTNKSTISGGGLAVLNNSMPALINLNIFNNSSSMGGGIAVLSSSSPIIRDSEITGNKADESGGGIYIFSNSMPDFSNVNIEDNNAQIMGGGIYVSRSTCIIRDVDVINNDADFGSGMAISTSTSALVDRCNIKNNINALFGGGIYIEGSNAPEIRNSIIATNQAQQGAGVYLENVLTPLIHFSTIADNTASIAGNGVYVQNESTSNLSDILTIRNSILFNNEDEINYNPGTGVIISNSDISDSNWESYSNNFSLDPIFTDDDLYRLGPGSPCKNRASDVNPPAFDIDGDVRPKGKGYNNEGLGYDIGADEALNVPPVAHDMEIDVYEDVSIEIALNATDEDGDDLTYNVVSVPEHGIITGEGKNIYYKPVENYNGTDSFTFKANDLLDSNIATVYLNVLPVNDAPSFTLGDNIQVKENSGPQLFSNWAEDIISGPSDEIDQTLTFKVEVKQNSEIFSVDPKVSPDGALTFTPQINKNGKAVIEISLSDDGETENNGVDQSAVKQFEISIVDVNDAPTFSLKTSNIEVYEDSGVYNSVDFALDINPGDESETEQKLRFEISTNNSSLFYQQPIIQIPSTGTIGRLTFTPASNANGKATVTVYLKDDGGTLNGGRDKSDPKQFVINILPMNDPPDFLPGPNQTVYEDEGPKGIPNWARLIAQPLDEEGQVLTYVLTPSNPTLFEAGPSITPDGTLTYTPAPNAFGDVVVDVVLKDNGGGSNTSTKKSFTISIIKVNDPPSFTQGLNPVAVQEDSGYYDQAWATNISSGPYESQNVSFFVTTNNNSLFKEAPIILPTGRLTFRLADNAYGTASVYVYLEDDGGILNNGSNRSSVSEFTIKINEVNDVPSFNMMKSISVKEDCGEQNITNFVTGINPGAENEYGQPIEFEVKTTTESLFEVLPEISSNGRLYFKPLLNASGIANLTVQLKDQGTTNGVLDPKQSSIQEFSLTINPVNDAPSFNKGQDIEVEEDSSPTTISSWATSINKGASNENAQTVTFYISTNNDELFAEGPSINSSGDLYFKPNTDKFGTATVTVYLQDDGGVSNDGKNTSDAVKFTISVMQKNDQPSFTKGPDQNVFESTTDKAYVIENWATNISAGVDENDQILTFHLQVVDGLSIFKETPKVLSDGSLLFTTLANKNGIARINIYLEDNGGGDLDSSSTVQFSINVESVNNKPSFVLLDADQVVLEDSGKKEVLNWATSISAGEGEEDQLSSLVFHTSTKNPALFRILPQVDLTGKLTFQPEDNANGIASVTVWLDDNAEVNNISVKKEFSITITPVNDSPSFDTGADVVAREDSGIQIYPAWASNIKSGPSNEASQNLTFNIQVNSTSGFNLFEIAPKIGTDGMLTFTPLKDQYGTAQITVILQDSAGTANGGSDKSTPKYFNITINPVNDAPSFVAGESQIVNEDEQAVFVPNWAKEISPGPTNELNQDFNFIVSTNNDSLFSVLPAVSKFGNLSFTPAPNENGSATIRVYLKDLAGTDDGGVDISTYQDIIIQVKSVNDPPDFDIGEDIIIKEVNTSNVKKSFSGWASNITKGAPNESSQILSFVINHLENASLFYSGPDISQNGTLTFTPTPYANGVATLSIQAQDNGGKVNGGNDISSIREFKINIIAVNNPPTFLPGADLSSLEDSDLIKKQEWATNISSGPSNESGQTYSFIVTTDNDELFEISPQINTAGDISYKPAEDAVGVAVMTIYCKDNGGDANGGRDVSEIYQKTITIEQVNDPPDFTPGSDISIYESTGLQTRTGWATNIRQGPLNESSQQYVFHIDTDNNNLFEQVPQISSDGTLTFKPRENISGVANASVWMEDTGGTANNGINESQRYSFIIKVEGKNDPPTFTKGSDQKIYEDSGQKVINYWATSISPGEPGEIDQILTFHVNVQNPNLFIVQPEISSTGTLTFTPGPNLNGSTLVTVYLEDDGGGNNKSSTETFMITIEPVNDSPSFVRGSNVIIIEDAGKQSIPNWATNINAGPQDELTQKLTFQLIPGDPSLFASGPVITDDGKLEFTPSVDRKGTAVVSVYLKDDGGVTNGGKDTSFPQTFTVTIIGVNDAPSFVKGPNQIIKEDAGAQTIDNWATNVKPGPTDESDQQVLFYLSNTNNILFTEQPFISQDGTLKYTPAPNAFGTATVSVFMEDTGGTANGGINVSETSTFDITILSVNDPPSFIPGQNQVISENQDPTPKIIPNWATNISSGPINEIGQTLEFKLEITNRHLFSEDPLISAAGTLTFTPSPGISGKSVITVYLTDNGGIDYGGDYISDAHQFTIEISSCNNPPTFTLGPNQIISEDSPEQIIYQWAKDISPGPADEVAQNVTFHTEVDNKGLFIKEPEIKSDGTLNYILTPNAYGLATVNVYLEDDGGVGSCGSNVSEIKVFTITINSVNDAPTFLQGINPLVLEDSGAQTLENWAKNISSGAANEVDQQLEFFVSPDKTELFAVPPAISPLNGNLTYTPYPDATGTSIVTAYLKDDGGTENGGKDISGTITFTITIAQVNDQPGFTPGLDLTILEDAGEQHIENWAKNISSGPDNESDQKLTFVIKPENKSLFAVEPVVDTNGKLTYTPANDAFGSSRISIFLQDNGGNENGGNSVSMVYEFNITIAPVNDSPSFTPGSGLNLNKNAGYKILPEWALNVKAGPENESGQGLSFFTSISGDTGIFEINPQISLNGALSFKIMDGKTGTSTVSVYLKDDGDTLYGGKNQSQTFSFDIRVYPMNTKPTFTRGDHITIQEDSGKITYPNWAKDISPGSSDEIGQVLTFIAASDRTSLFKEQPQITSDGTLSFTPDDNEYGQTTVSVYLKDDGGILNGGQDTSDTKYFNITIEQINDPPSFTIESKRTIDEDSGRQVLPGFAHNIQPGPINEYDQGLFFNVTTDKNSLFKELPEITPSGMLSFEALNDANGEINVYVQLQDDGGKVNGGSDTSVQRQFLIIINPINDPPNCTIAPSISGKPEVGQTLVAYPGNWNDDNDQTPGNIQFKYQWQLSDTPDAYNLINIFAQITNSLIIRPEYDSKYIRIEVTGKDDGEGNSSMSKTVYSSFIYIGGIQSGDINGDGKLDIKDCIITAQLLTNINSIGIISGADINKNNKIGMEEFIYLLMSVSGSK